MIAPGPALMQCHSAVTSAERVAGRKKQKDPCQCNVWEFSIFIHLFVSRVYIH